MDFSPEDFFKQIRHTRIGVAQDRLSRLELDWLDQKDIKVIAALGTSAIMAKDYATLQLISNAPDLETFPKTEEAAAYMALKGLVNTALVQREPSDEVKELRNDQERLSDFLFSITDESNLEAWNNLDSLVVDALRNNDAAALDLILNYCQRAMSPGLTLPGEIVKRGRYDSLVKVALLGLEWHIPEVSGNSLATLAYIHDQPRKVISKPSEAVTGEEFELRRLGLLRIERFGGRCFLRLTPRGKAALQHQLPDD